MAVIVPNKETAEEQPRKESLHVKESFEQIQERYKGLQTKIGTNFLIYGLMGSGKTVAAATAPLPIIYHSFDPGGTDSIRKIYPERMKQIAVDNRFEREDAMKPTAYDLWEAEFNRLASTDTFNSIGTYVLDMTMWLEAIMNKIVYKASRAGEQPQLQDYLKQQIITNRLLKNITSLPCHVVCLGHIQRDKDEVTGSVVNNIAVSGKMTTKIPILFGEVYVAQTISTSKGVEYKLLTQNDGYYQARSRLGAKLEKLEEPNLERLINKVTAV